MKNTVTKSEQKWHTLEAKPCDQNAENWKRENRLFTSTVVEAGASGAKSNRYARTQKSSNSLIRFRCSNSFFLLETGIAGHEKLFLAKWHRKAEKKTAKTAVFRHRWQVWKVARSIAAVRQRPRTPWNWRCSFAFFGLSFDISIKNSVQRWSSDFQTAVSYFSGHLSIMHVREALTFVHVASLTKTDTMPHLQLQELRILDAHIRIVVLHRVSLFQFNSLTPCRNEVLGCSEAISVLGAQKAMVFLVLPLVDSLERSHSPGTCSPGLGNMQPLAPPYAKGMYVRAVIRKTTYPDAKEKGMRRLLFLNLRMKLLSGSLTVRMKFRSTCSRHQHPHYASRVPGCFRRCRGRGLRLMAIVVDRVICDIPSKSRGVMIEIIGVFYVEQHYTLVGSWIIQSPTWSQVVGGQLRNPRVWSGRDLGHCGMWHSPRGVVGIDYCDRPDFVRRLENVPGNRSDLFPLCVFLEKIMTSSQSFSQIYTFKLF